MCLGGVLRSCRKPSPQELFVSRTAHQTSQNASWDKGLYVGPGTSRLYSPQQIEALTNHEQSPIALFSSDDAKDFSDPENRESCLLQIASWLPKSIYPSKDLLERIYAHIQYALPPETFPLYSYQSNPLQDQKYIGAVIFIPGSAFGKSMCRVYSGINVPSSLLDQELVKEISYAAAAHEVSHGDDFYQHRNTKSYMKSEYKAEVGEHEFIAQYPQFFPVLSDATKAQAILAGGRAYLFLLSFQSVRDENEDYIRTVFLSPQTPHAMPSTSEGIRAESDMIEKVAHFIYEHGLLPGFDAHYHFLALKNWDRDKVHEEREFLISLLSETMTKTVCFEDACSNPELTTKVADASDPLLNLVIATVEKLKSQGAFPNEASSIYADNLLAGAPFYLDQGAFNKARADVANKSTIQIKDPQPLRLTPR